MHRVIKSSINNDKSLSWKDKKQWLSDNLGFTEKEARDAVYALEYYTDRGYRSIHNRDFSNDDCFGTAYDEELIDSILLHSSMPKYTGTLYRGLTVDHFEPEKIQDIIDSGIWKEPGITSFTSSIDIAKSYAFNCDSLHDPVLITMLNNKHAKEIGFLSQGGGEGEYLYPSLIKDRGLKIVDWKTEDHWSTRIRKKTGKPSLIHRNYYITVQDW